MNKKYLLWAIFISLVIVPSTLAECPPDCPQDKDVYDFIGQPTETWTAQDFAKLSAQDPEAARDLLSDKGPEIMDKVGGNPNNKQLDIFDEVLDDDEVSFENEREKDIAYTYMLSQKPEANGKIIPRSRKSRKVFRKYSRTVTKREVKVNKNFKGKIKAVENGFEIVDTSAGGNRKLTTNQMKEGSDVEVESGKIKITEPEDPRVDPTEEPPEPTVTVISGDYEGEVQKAGNIFTVTNGNNQYLLQKIPGVENELNFKRDGTASISGTTPEFAAFIGGDLHSFNNQEGTSRVSPNGDAESQNAIYKVVYSNDNQRELGREINGQFKCSTNVCSLQALHGRNTRFDSITRNGAQTVSSQGNQVFVTIGGEKPQIQGSNYIWISENGESLEARGRVLTYSQKVTAGLLSGIDFTKPMWTGTDSDSSFNIFTDSAGRTSFIIEGAGQYFDIAKELRTQQGVKVTQKLAASHNSLDLLTIECEQCADDAEAALLSIKLISDTENYRRNLFNPITGKTVAIHLAKRASEDFLDISFVANNNQLSPQIGTDIGQLADKGNLFQIKNAIISFGDKNIAIVNGQYGVLEENTEDGPTSLVSLDLGIKGIVGGPILRTNREIAEFEAFIETFENAVDSADISQLPKITTDPNVRKVILQSTGIELDLLRTNPKYARGIILGNKISTQRIPNIIAELSSLGFDFDPQGNCISPPDCIQLLISESQSGGKISSAHAELRQALREADANLLQAERIKAVGQGKQTENIDALLEDVNLRLSERSEEVEFENLVRTTQDELHPEEQNLISEASNLGGQLQAQLNNILHTDNDLTSINGEVTRLKRGLAIQAGLFNTGSAEDRAEAKQRYLILVANTPEITKLENRLTALENGVNSAKLRANELRNQFLKLTDDPRGQYIRTHILRATGIPAYVELARQQEEKNREDLLVAGYLIPDKALQFQQAKEGWDLATLGDPKNALTAVDGLSIELPGVQFVKSDYRCKLGGLCKTAQDLAISENERARHQLALQRSDEESVVDKTLTKTGIISLIGFGAHVHNAFADDLIILPEEAAEGFLISPVGTTLDLLGAGTDFVTDDILDIWDPWESDYERNTEAVAFNRKRSGEIAQLRTQLATGVPLENVAQSDYVKSSEFSCKYLNQRCEQAAADALILKSKFHPESASLIYEDMQVLASQGNADAEEWLEKNTAAVGLHRLGKGVVLAGDILAPFAVAKLTAVNKASRLQKLRELHLAIDNNDLTKALELSDVVKPTLAARISKSAEKPIKAIKETAGKVGSRIAPEGSRIRKLAAGIVDKAARARDVAGRIANIRLSKQPGYKQAISALEAEETAQLRMQLLGKLKNGKFTMDNGQRTSLLQIMGLTENTLNVAYSIAIDEFILASANADAVLANFPGAEAVLNVDEFGNSLHPKATDDVVQGNLGSEERGLANVIEDQVQATDDFSYSAAQYDLDTLAYDVELLENLDYSEYYLPELEQGLGSINAKIRRVQHNHLLSADDKDRLISRLSSEHRRLQDHLLNYLEIQLADRIGATSIASSPADNLEKLMLEIEYLEQRAYGLSETRKLSLRSKIELQEKSLEQRLQELSGQSKSSRETLLQEPDDLLDPRLLGDRNRDLASTLEGRVYTDEDIFALSNGLLLRLRSSSKSQDPLDVISQRQIIRYRNRISEQGGYIDYIEQIDQRFPPEAVIVNLGTDGIAYTNLAHLLSTSNPKPNSITHYISRRTLATRKEAEAILAQTGGQTQAVEAAVNIQSRNIKLYDDVNTAVIDSHVVHVDTRGVKHFDGALARRFDRDVMTVPQNQDKVVELVGQMRDTLVASGRDVDQHLVLTDYAGRAHVQGFTLKNGVRWLADEQNWASLTDAQRASLGGSRARFVNSRVDLHVGVTKTVPTETNPLSGIGLDDVFEIEARGDVVESFRGVQLNDRSLATDQLVFQPTTPYEQAQTLSQKLIIADEIAKRKAQRLLGSSPTAELPAVQP
tara:strand:+ start:40327 stop:46272 length:5946 start_codon:yes stop_codon:yes gene_type:complete